MKNKDDRPEDAAEEIRIAEEALRQSEGRLAESNQLLASVLEHTHMMAVFLDPHFNFIWVNRAYANACGHAPSFFPGKNHFELYPHEENQAIFKSVADTLEPFFAAAKPFEFPDQPERGVTYWDWSLIPVTDAGGKVSGLVLTLTEVTERIRTVEALRESEEKHRRIIEALSDAFLLRSNEIVIDANPAALKLFRANHSGDLIGKRYLDLVHPDDWALSAERLKLSKDENRIASPREHRILALDGQVVHVESIGGLVKHQNETQIFEVYRDVTERKRAEAVLRTASLYSRNLIEASLDPLVTISAEGKITDVNTATEKITGLSRKSLIGSDFVDYFTEAETARAGYLKVFEQGQVMDYPLAVRHTSGAITEVLYNASLYRNEQGKVLGVFAAARNITKLRRAEDEKAKLEAQYRQLQKAESLGRMAGAIAHHLNNRLGAVMGNLELAMLALPSTAKPVAYLTEAMQAARRAAEVSGLMLTYLGQTQGKRELLDLSEACRRSLPMLQAAMPGNVVLKTDLPSPGPSIIADVNQIQQVLTNLCTNAWEALGYERRAIHLVVKAVSAADIPASPRFPLDWQPKESIYACLEVADAGCGIAGQDIEKLFDPFFSSKFTGRGLGLPVVLGIMRTYDGGITVQSELGHGSIFRVFFQVSNEKVPRQPEKVASASEIKGGGTVLLVEDDELLHKTNETVLAHLGYSVLSAWDGVEAIEVFRQHQNDICLVICDLTMPRMDGWETLAALRDLAPGIPVILTSGYNEAQVMAGDHPTLPEAFLEKPYRLKELRETIARALAGKK